MDLPKDLPTSAFLQPSSKDELIMLLKRKWEDKFHENFQLKREIKQLKEQLDKLKSLSKKLVKMFPEKIEEDEEYFDIPAYVIDEMKELLKEGKDDT